MSNTIHATINGLPIEVATGTSILDAARQVHVHHLGYREGVGDARPHAQRRGRVH